MTNRERDYLDLHIFSGLPFKKSDGDAMVGPTEHKAGLSAMLVENRLGHTNKKRSGLHY